MNGKAHDSRRAQELVLITGSRRGIGLGIAQALSELGFTIILNGVSPPSEAAAAIAKIEANRCLCRYIQADIAKKEDRRRLVLQIRQEFGRLDILVNNAGVAPKPREDILEASEESFDRLINTNLKGPYFLTQAVANWMIEQKRDDPLRNPMIINMGSLNSYTPSVSRGDYCVSKAGLSMMTALFSIRLAEFGIRVYEIRPGIIKTDMTSPVRERYDRLIAEGITPIKRWGTPEDVAKAVVALVEGCLPFSTGEIINVDGGFHLRSL
ncbi:MAG: 3-ketoacyl-ACP reductase [Deltaproteobacteria bacterium]|nr:3-ketoacyl-ACP reductase [Deltaproteobacteria bacterium]